MIKIDEIRKSKKRKSFVIKFIEGKLVVYAPKGLSDKKIAEIIEKNKEKIEKKLWIWKKNEPSPKKFEDGEKISFLGKQYPIIKINSDEKFINFSGSYFYLKSPNIQISRMLFETFFKNEAYKYICKRTSELAVKHNFFYNKCGITKAKTRWGSCSIKNNLNFSLFLIMAPKSVIDYVIIHELAHTIEKNHSRNFWNIVKRIMPNYKIYKNWLKENINLLRF